MNFSGTHNIPLLAEHYELPIEKVALVWDVLEWKINASDYGTYIRVVDYLEEKYGGIPDK